MAPRRLLCGFLRPDPAPRLGQVNSLSAATHLRCNLSNRFSPVHRGPVYFFHSLASSAARRQRQHGSLGGQELAGNLRKGELLKPPHHRIWSACRIDGTVFAVYPFVGGLTNLYSFTAVSGSSLTNSDGAYPLAGLVLSDNTLYGTTAGGGGMGHGPVFSISLPVLPIFTWPQLTIIPSGTNVIITWPSTNASILSLVTTPTLVSPTEWSYVTSSRFLIHGQYVVTNPISGTQMFFRLSQ